MTYGCKDRAPYPSAVPAQSGWYMDGYTRTPRMEAMPFRMATDCQYTETTLGQADKGCDGCTWRKS